MQQHSERQQELNPEPGGEYVRVMAIEPSSGRRKRKTKEPQSFLRGIGNQIGPFSITGSYLRRQAWWKGIGRFVDLVEEITRGVVWQVQEFVFGVARRATCPTNAPEGE